MRLPVLFAAAAITLLTGMGAAAQQRKEPPFVQDSVCVGGGPYGFNGVAAKTEDSVPSVLKQISVLGLYAAQANCEISLTCVSEARDSAAKQEARRPCTIAAWAAKKHVPWSQRRDEVRAIKITVDNPASPLERDKVYMTFTPK